jgi:cell division transport system permease protein
MMRRSDLSFERDESSRFLPWIIAFMVYLAALALAGAMILDAGLLRWDQSITGTFTVQVPPPAADEGTAGATRTEHLQTVLRRLMDMPGVHRAKLLADEETAALLEPWLGVEGLSNTLPLPALIDLEIEKGADLDAKAVQARLADVVPGVVVDDHRSWLDPALALARSIQWLAAVIVILIGIVATGAVAFTTRTGLYIHRDVIELMHLMGAHDSYIARQFQFHALAIGLWGGFLGLLLAGLTLVGLMVVPGHGELTASAVPALPIERWLLLAALPVASGIIALLTARFTVLRALARRP